MPIRPERKGLYPPNWKEIRARILKRAGDCCEDCGVLKNPIITRVDIVEIDKNVIKLVGPYMPMDPRLNIIHADIFEHIKSHQDYDCAWYDLWTEDDSLQVKHIELLISMKNRTLLQGAWGYPQGIKKIAKRYMEMA